ELYVEVAGHGPNAVVLLRPGLWDRRTWDREFGLLAELGYTVVRYDARGYGRSSRPAPGEPYSPVRAISFPCWTPRGSIGRPSSGARWVGPRRSTPPWRTRIGCGRWSPSRWASVASRARRRRTRSGRLDSSRSRLRSRPEP